MEVPQASASQAAFREQLVEKGLLVPSVVPGVTGQGPVFVDLRRRLNARLTELFVDENALLLEFPPIEPRHEMETVGYMSTFPHLAGSVFAYSGDEAEALELGDKAQEHQDWSGHLSVTQVVLNPAACHPVYPALARLGFPAEGLTVDTGDGWVFRHEPSDDPCRMQSFHMRELVRVGPPEAVGAWRDTWRDRSVEFLRSLGLPTDVDEASDPFFGRSGRMLARSQRSQKLKFEALVPVGGDGPTAVWSFNAHGDHFSSVYGLGDVHTACLGIGIERIVLSLLYTHGLDPATWPVQL